MEYKAQDLIKSYGGAPILRIETLRLAAGDFVALLGKNGGGKSTLMRLLAQAELHDAGTLTLDGESLLSTKLRVNGRVAFIGEDHSLPFSRPIQRWFEIYRKIHAGYDIETYERLKKKLDVDDTKPLTALSRGQKMKALFCLEAGRKPAAYLLDEITAVLDSGSRWTLMEFLAEETKRGCLTVMSTNIASELNGFANKVLILEAGRVVFAEASTRLSAHFAKHRLPSQADDRGLRDLGARRITFNEDQSWTYLMPRSERAIDRTAGVLDDLREITIADVQSYFTAGGTPS